MSTQSRHNCNGDAGAAIFLDLHDAVRLHSPLSTLTSSVYYVSQCVLRWADHENLYN